MLRASDTQYLLKIEELEARLADAEQLIEAIKAGEVDAFALMNGNDHPEIFTLQSGDYAYRVLVENFSEGAVNLSEQGMVVYTNTYFHKLIGLTYEEVIGRPVTDFIHTGSIELFQELFTVAIAEQARGEIILKKGNDLVPVYISLTSLQPQLPTVGMIVTDLTWKKEAEREHELTLTLQNIFRQAPAAIALLQGPDHIFISANTMYLQIANRKEAEVLGKKIIEVFPEVKQQGIIDRFDRVFRTGETDALTEMQVSWDKNQDGKLVTCFFNSVLQPIKDDNGKVISIMSYVMDVTEQMQARKKIEDSEREFRNITEAIPQLVWVCNEKGEATYFNDQWYQFTGATTDESLGYRWAELLHPDDVAPTMKAWQEAREAIMPCMVEFRLRTVGGAYRWVYSKGIPFMDSDGQVEKWFGTCTDIHERKSAEQRIIEEDQRKSDFIKMVSHELKTPITSIKGYVQLMLAMLADEKSAINNMIQNPLARIDNQVERLGRLISEILDVSKLESAVMEMDKEYFSLGDFLKQTLQDIQFANGTHRLVITETFPCMIYADKNRIGQAIINLVNNAIKYSPDQHQVELRMYRADHDFVAIAIKDWGVGIDKSEHEKIFQRFYRAGGRNYTGFGIGLYIVNEIVQRHGGHISVESKKNEGSLFTIFLPYNTEKPSYEQEAADHYSRR